MKKKLASNEVRELKELKRTINDTAEACEKLVTSAKDRSRQALAEALTCGKALCRVKSIIGFGGFGKWIKENCAGISESTAQNYMRLSQHVGDLLATGVGLRQAYVSLGILKEEDETQMEGSQPTVLTCDGSRSEVSMQQHARATAPLANAVALSKGKQPIVSAMPQVSTEDQLSRVRYLVGELVSTINNRITMGIAVKTIQQELKPLGAWVKPQRD